MVDKWKNEMGSALLLVMMGVMIAGIVFGGLYLVAGYTNRQAATHREQVVAEYDAQGLMNIALAYYYNNTTLFNQKFSGNNSCIDSKGNTVDVNSTPNVCLKVNGTTQTFVATGTDTDSYQQTTLKIASNHSAKLGTQSNTITYILPGGDTPLPPPPPPDNSPSDGQTCPSTNGDYILRALVTGTDFDTSRVEPLPASGVNIDGGVYIGNQAVLIMPRKETDYTIKINGNVTAEGGYRLDNGNGNGNVSKHPLSSYGNPIDDMGCRISPTSWNEYMTGLASHINSTAQQVPVYKFVGSPAKATTTGGMKKNVGDSYFSPIVESLGNVLQSRTDKIVLIQGSLRLDPDAKHNLTTTGDLIVYNTLSNPGTIYLPDYVNWTHSGAVETEQVGDVTSGNAITWPSNYQLSIVLTKNQYNLYKQTK